MSKRVKTTYDRGYVNAMDKIRVFIESNQKVMYIDTGEYKNAQSARAAYANAIALIRAKGIVRPVLDQKRHLRRKGAVEKSTTPFIFITHTTGLSIILLQRRFENVHHHWSGAYLCDHWLRGWLCCSVED